MTTRRGVFGLILGAIAVFIIERDFMKASAFSLVGAVLTYFGFMHGERIGIGQTPVVAVSYLAVSVILMACAKFAVVAPAPAEESLHGHEEAPATGLAAVGAE